MTSNPDEGLGGLVAHAARAAAGEDATPIGVLELELERDDSSSVPRVAVEAAFAQQDGKRVVERLGVRLRVSSSEQPEAALASATLGEFGGTAFTNFTLSHPAESGDVTGPYRVADAGAPSGEFELIDLTVSFPSRVRFYARNEALLGEGGSSADLEARIELAERLGARHRTDHGKLSFARRQLRQPMTVEQQVSALLAAAARGLHVAVYSASLPPRKTARLEITPRPDRGARAHELDCCVIRGLYTFGGNLRTSTAIDALEIQRFIERRFGFVFGDKQWRLLNVHADRPQLRVGVIPRRR